MKGERRIEVLAPAGSFESMKAAVNAGADAVYMGGTRFGARAYAENPETDRLLEAIDYVHLHGKKLYLTVNTLLKEQELSEELYDFLVPVYEAGVDALIVQDLGVWEAVRRWFPELPLHASTQMTITGVTGALEIKRRGAVRIVPARELSIEEIRKLHEQADLELEVFVHGALCYCYSGQCLFSSLAGGRSGNRGRCAQPCRLPYGVWEGKSSCLSPGASYLLNLKDLCGLDSLGELLDAGVCSLKIEGRMKSPRYTAGVVSVYRKYVDLYKKVGSEGWKVASEDKKLLAELFDRGGFSDGYFHMRGGRKMLALSRRPFRRPDAGLFDRLDQTYVKPEKKEKIKGNIRITQDLPVKLSFKLGDTAVSIEGEPALPAKSRPLSEEELGRRMEKLGDTPFVLEDFKTELCGDCFVPVGGLNELRRKAASALKEELLKKYRRTRSLPGQNEKLFEKETGKSCPENTEWEAAAGKKPLSRFSVLVEEEEQFLAAVSEKAVGRIYFSVDAMEPGQVRRLMAACKRAGKECFLALPRIWREGVSFVEALPETEKENGDRREGADGFLVRVLDECFVLEEEKGEFVADASLYTFNREARKALFSRGFAMDTAPFELNRRELFLRGIVGSEVVVYGRLPMMVSAQCIRKTVKGCRKAQELPDGPLVLTDRKRMRFPVKQYCRFCYNVIYNQAPLWLAKELPDLAAMGPRMLRLQFTTEGKEEVTAVIRAYEAALAGKKYDYRPELLTRGHFRRGVE